MTLYSRFIQRSIFAGRAFGLFSAIWPLAARDTSEARPPLSRFPRYGDFAALWELWESIQRHTRPVPVFCPFACTPFPPFFVPTFALVLARAYSCPFGAFSPYLPPRRRPPPPLFLARERYETLGEMRPDEWTSG